MYYVINEISTITHTVFNPKWGAGQFRLIDETYVDVSFWESKELHDAGKKPHWREDFHRQHVGWHLTDPMKQIDHMIRHAYNSEKNRGRTGDTRLQGILAQGHRHDGDPAGVLNHPEVRAVREEIAKRREAK